MQFNSLNQYTLIVNHVDSVAHVHHHGTEGQSPTSPCDCPAYLHDRESPLVISQVNFTMEEELKKEFRKWSQSTIEVTEQ